MEISRGFFKDKFAAFPDLHSTLTDIIAEGDRVANWMDIEAPTKAH